MVRALLIPVLLLLGAPPAAAEQSDGEPQSLPEVMDAPSPRPADDSLTQPPATSLPREELACRDRLRTAGVVFSESEPISEPAGCRADWPLTVSSVAGGVELRPAATLTCAMAEATSDFVRDHAAPRAHREFGVPLVAIDQVSSYVCRPRAGGGKLSEHAFANALDWGGLELADGTTVEVRHHRRSEPRRAELLAALREAACGPFKIVLGPGSDADHADHFHFDLAERRNGGTWCR